jgi:Mg-chelatase subunit ChlD
LSDGRQLGDKIKQAKQGATGFAEEAFRKGYKVGLIQFGSYASPVAEASFESGSIRAGVEKLFADPNGSTNMTAGIELSINKLRDVQGDRVICIVTDGQPDNREAALSMAREAKKLRIDIMTIGTDDADRAFLEQLATRKELSTKVEREKLQEAITSMAKLLPG